MNRWGSFCSGVAFVIFYGFRCTSLRDMLCSFASQFGLKDVLYYLALLTWLGPAWCVSSARSSHGVRSARRVVDTLVQFLYYEDSVRPRCSQRGRRFQVLQWSRAECLGTGHGEADWHWRSIFHLGAGSEGSCGARDERSWAEQQQRWRHARLSPPRRRGLHDRSGTHQVINKNSLENGLPDPCHVFTIFLQPSAVLFPQNKVLVLFVNLLVLGLKDSQLLEDVANWLRIFLERNDPSPKSETVALLRFVGPQCPPSPDITAPRMPLPISCTARTLGATCLTNNKSLTKQLAS